MDDSLDVGGRCSGGGSGGGRLFDGLNLICREYRDGWLASLRWQLFFEA